MDKVVGIQFKDNGKIYDFDPGPFVLRKDDMVIVLTEEGPSIGNVCIESQNRREEIAQRTLKKVFRLATPEEIDKYQKSRAQEARVFEYCQKKINAMCLPMCLVSVEWRFDGSKVIVYFTADGRVDFRELVKDLVNQFRCRIEMRQIGVRQQAKMVGGLGPCGRPLCCATFLNSFAPVTIKMAKCQNISLNPSKISGMCGRLMCCLNYEYAFYEKSKKFFPKTGKKVTTKEGEGKVIRQNVLKQSLTVLLDSGGEVEVNTNELVRERLFKKKSKKKKQERDPEARDNPKYRL